MSKAQASPRRERVPGRSNHNLYFHRNVAGAKIYEIGYRDGGGKQKFETSVPRSVKRELRETRRWRDAAEVSEQKPTLV